MVTMVKMRLMLVDDEAEFLATMQKILERRGYSVLTASGGEACLKRLEDELVHVVILDVQMPGMSGVETLRRIKQDHPMIEVIMLTGNATVTSAVEGMRLGALDYLLKPAPVDELLAKAEKAFQKRLEVEQNIKMAEAMKKSGI
jgi:DNA-binding NtrC family response regulator